MRLFSTKRTLYEILQVSNDSNLKEIKSQYYKLCKLFHPDTRTKKSNENYQEFQDILMAFETLKDPKKRKEYDRSLALIKYQEPQTSLKDFDFKPKKPDFHDRTIKFWSKMEIENKRKQEEDGKENKSINERLDDMRIFRDRVLVVCTVLFGYWLSTTFGN
jgi:DnaJ-class molecular chaperone